MAWTDVVDARLTESLRDHHDGGASGGVTLIALGSYARRSLCPESDIDLLILHDGWSSGDLEGLVRAVCYPLWDAGLSVGHAVRTVKDAIKSMSDRIDTATALTDRRLVAGSQGLADDLSARMAKWLRRNGGAFARQIVQADQDRQRRHGGTAGALEPDLKAGNGALRDLHSLRWAGAILLGQAGLDPLVGARYLGADERARLAGAGDRLLAARCALHMVGGKSVHDTLRLDLQDEVAVRLGMADGDVLLRDVGLATRTIAHLHARTWPVMLEDATSGRRRRRPTPRPAGAGVVLIDGLVEVTPDAALENDQSLGLRAVAAAAEHATVIGRRSAMVLRREVVAAGSLPWDDEARDALVRILRSGRGGMSAMRDADYLGLWDAYLPEWHRVRGRPQRNPLHTFDLDTHAMQASAWLADVVAGELDQSHTDIFEAMEDPDGLVLGTWLHDVGKAWPGDHSESGEVVGRQWMLHMGFSGRRADQVAKLILLHLVLPDVATQRDIDDPDEIERVALMVGDVETLDGLYLLGMADARATGKAAWSDWKDLLIRRLYEKVRRLLTGQVGVLAGPSPADLVVRSTSHFDGDVGLLRKTVEGLPERYLRNAGPEQVAAHCSLLDGFESGLRASVRPGPVASVETLSVVSIDRHGLFADVVGVLASNRIEVQQARAFTHDDGTVLDWFVVTPPEHLDWTVVIAELEATQRDEHEVAEAVERRERSRDVRPPVLARPVAVRVATYDRGDVTRIEVRGPDSPGVLFRLARVLSDLGTELTGALVATLGPEVRDAFFVVGDLPPQDELEAALTPALLDTPAVAQQ